jgi:hypothetical protein
MILGEDFSPLSPEMSYNWSEELDMGDDIKRIDLKEFWELGFIQEINRRFLHPCGLALEIIMDTETREVSLGGVWDYRDDSEGMYFSEDVMSKEKYDTVEKLLHSKEDARRTLLGYVTQPPPKE